MEAISARTEINSDRPKVLRRKIYGYNWDRIQLLAHINERAFRIIWILAQYNRHTFDIPFEIAISEINAFVLNKKGIKRYNPTRAQILGKMFELKMRNFISYFDHAGIDIVQYASKASVNDLLMVSQSCEDVFFELQGASVKLQQEDWNTLLYGDFVELAGMSIGISINWRKVLERIEPKSPIQIKGELDEWEL